MEFIVVGIPIAGRKPLAQVEAQSRALGGRNREIYRELPSGAAQEEGFASRGLCCTRKFDMTPTHRANLAAPEATGDRQHDRDEQSIRTRRLQQCSRSHGVERTHIRALDLGALIGSAGFHGSSSHSVTATQSLFQEPMRIENVGKREAARAVLAAAAEDLGVHLGNLRWLELGEQPRA